MLVLSQYDALSFARTGHFQDRTHFLVTHPACGSIGAPFAAGEVAWVPVPAAEPVLQPEKDVNASSHNNDEQVIHETGEREPFCPAVQYASSDWSHRHFPGHTAT